MTGWIESSKGIRLAYDAAGSGPPVVLVHGLGLSRRRWQAQVEALVEAGFRAIRFDLRGFGESPLPPGPYRMEDLVADLSAVADAEAPGSFHLVGHSLGGMVALAYAVRNPQRLRSLTLASTTSHNGRRASEIARLMARVSSEGLAALRDESLRARAQAILAQAFPGKPPPLEALARGLSRPNPAHAYAWAATAGFSVKDDLDRIRCPVLVLHGTADPMIPWAVGYLIHLAIPSSRWVALEGAGHSIQVERAAEVNAALLALLRDAERAV